MPASYVKKLANLKGVSVTNAEKKWNSAKDQAAKEGHAEDYAYITSIFKRMMHAAALTNIPAGQPMTIAKVQVAATKDILLDSAVATVQKRIKDLFGVTYAYRAQAGGGSDTGVTFITKRWGGKVMTLQQILKTHGFVRQGLATPKYVCWGKTVDYGPGQPAYQVSISLVAGTPDVVSIWIGRI